MLGLSCVLSIAAGHLIITEKLLTARPLPKAPPQVRRNVSLLRLCLGLKNFLGPRDPKRIGRA